MVRVETKEDETALLDISVDSNCQLESRCNYIHIDKSPTHNQDNSNMRKPCWKDKEFSDMDYEFNLNCRNENFNGKQGCQYTYEGEMITQNNEAGECNADMKK